MLRNPTILNKQKKKRPRKHYLVILREVAMNNTVSLLWGVWKHAFSNNQTFINNLNILTWDNLYSEQQDRAVLLLLSQWSSSFGSHALCPVPLCRTPACLSVLLCTVHTHLSCDRWQPSVLWAFQSSISWQERGDAWQTPRCVTKTGRASQAFLWSWTRADQDSNLQHCSSTLGGNVSHDTGMPYL